MRKDIKVIERAEDHLKLKSGEKVYVIRYKHCTRTKAEIECGKS